MRDFSDSDNNNVFEFSFNGDNFPFAVTGPDGSDLRYPVPVVGPSFEIAISHFPSFCILHLGPILT